MELKEFFLDQLEREAVASRKVVERVPEGHNSWKPHEKSMELGRLASLVATMPRWVGLMIDDDELDLNAGNSFSTGPLGSTAELISALDEGVAHARRSLQATTEGHLMKHWRLKMGDQIFLDQPRYVAIGDGAFAHLAHHRGQLTVYLRLLEAKVPAIYGPSADEA